MGTRSLEVPGGNARRGEAVRREEARGDSVAPNLLERILDALQQLQAGQCELGERLDGRLKSHYTVEELGELTGRTAYTVRAWIRKGQLSAIRIQGSGPRGRLLVPRSELERLVASGKGRGIPAGVLEQATNACQTERTETWRC